MDGALGAAAAELARPLTADESKLVQDLVSMGIGGAVGGKTVAGTTLTGEVFNRQLHPKEIDQVNELAKDFMAVCGCTEAEARDRLMTQAGQNVDLLYNLKIGETDEQAASFLKGGKFTEQKAAGLGTNRPNPVGRHARRHPEADASNPGA